MKQKKNIVFEHMSRWWKMGWADIATCRQPNPGQNIGIQTERHWVFEPVRHVI